MPDTAIAGVVLAGAELAPIEDAIVVIAAGKIVAVGAASAVTVPDGVEVVDASGCVLAPGFIDAHVHIGFYDPREVLAGGVTTARDLAWPPEVIFELVAQSQSDDFDGPTLLAAGPMLTAPGGYPARAAWAPAGTARELDNPGAARRAVGELAARATIIKVALNPPVGPVLDDATLAATVEAAHAHGLRVTGHVYGLAQLRRAIDAGVDELAHMLMSSETIPETTIAEMVAAGMTIVPTLSIRSGTDLAIAIDNLDRFRSAGGTIIYGTDLGNEGPRPGIDAREVGAMARAGMSLIDIVRAATIKAARYLGVAGVGAIAPGMDADLVAFRGALSDGPGLLEKVVRVWRRGRGVT